jgi:hypothetical protein
MRRDRKLLIAMLESIQRMVKIVALVMTGIIVLLDLAFVHPVKQGLIQLWLNQLVSIVKKELILALGHPSANYVRQGRIHLSELSIVSSVKTAELVNLSCLLVLLVRTLFVMYAQ